MDNIIFAKYDMDSGYVQAWTEDCNLILIDCDAYFQLCIIVPGEETEVYSFFVDAQTGEFLIKPLVYCIGS